MKKSACSLALLPLVASLAACASTRSEAPRDTGPPTSGHTLVLYSAGADELFSDPRDAGLRRAVEMLGERLLDLPAELGKSDFPRPVGELARDVLSAPMSMRVDVDEDADAPAGMALEAQLTVHGDPEEIGSIASRFRLLLESAFGSAGEPAPAHGDVRAVELPQGSVYHGILRSEGTGERRFALSWGEPDAAPLVPSTPELPRGVEPVLAFELDMARLRGPLERLLTMEGPDESERGKARDLLERFGLLSESPIFIRSALGFDGDRACVGARYGNYAQVLRGLGALVEEPLERDELRLIPADATLASISRVDLSFLAELARDMHALEDEEGAPDPLELARSVLGIDLDADLLAHLGTTVGYYFSERTGGGGLASGVLFATVDDEAGLAETIAHLSALVDQKAREHADGRIRVSAWEHDEVRCRSLTFPGLPVPLELSLALAEGHLLVTATPQALVAALDHLRGNGPALVDQRGFRADAGGRLDGLMTLTYQNTGALIHDGYGLATLLSSALANAVRSEERDPGLVLPPFGELVGGARPSIVLVRLEGDDLVYSGRMDASHVSNVTAFLGSPVSGLVLASVGTSVAVPMVLRQAMMADAMAEAARAQALMQEQRAAELQLQLKETQEADEPVEREDG